MTLDEPAPSPTAPAARPSGGRWRHWRRGRPFTAGVLIALGGAEMLVTLRAPLGVLLHVGPQGLAAYLVPIILVLCGVLLIATPQQRVFYALVSLIMGLISWLTSNLGGFVVGMLLALVGGALAFAWTPDKRPRVTQPAPAPPAPRSPLDSDEPAPETLPSADEAPEPAEVAARHHSPETNPEPATASPDTHADRG